MNYNYDTIVKDLISKKMYGEIVELMTCFKGSCITDSYELIVDQKENIYFRIDDVNDELTLKCKILEWLSRPAHTSNLKTQNKILVGINQYLKTSFSKEDIERVYTELGNNCNRELCIKFINSNYDLGLLEK